MTNDVIPHLLIITYCTVGGVNSDIMNNQDFHFGCSEQLCSFFHILLYITWLLSWLLFQIGWLGGKFEPKCKTKPFISKRRS